MRRRARGHSAGTGCRYDQPRSRGRHLVQRQEELVLERTATAGCSTRHAVKGRLNLFQAAMLRWRALHPYNATHALRIDRPLDAARLSMVIDGELEAAGLTGLALDAKRERFEYAGGAQRTALAVVPGGEEPLQILR